MNRDIRLHCFAEPERWDEQGVVLSPGESHHLVRVLRMKAGDRVSVLDGCGRTARAVLADASKNGVSLEFQSVTSTPSPRPRIMLVQALIKNNRMDWVIQKMVELGVAELYPFLADRSEIKIEQARKESRRTRMKTIAMSALKQSGHAWLPAIHEPISLEQSLEQLPANARIFYGSIEAPSVPFRNALRQSDQATPESVALIIGPVGDLSAREYDLLHESKAQPVSLGKQILRVETASLYMISAVRYEYENH